VNPADYILDVLDNLRLIKIFFIIYPLLLIVNWLIFRKVFNGLIVLVFASAIVFSVFIDLNYSHLLNGYRILYFIFSDVLIYLGVLFIYRRVIRSINKEDIFLIFKNFNQKYFVFAVIWLFIGILINLQNVSWEGTSRIAFQTERWYSVIRMISLLINPFIGLLLIFNLYDNNKFKLGILILLTIFLSATAGSKSGFVFSFIMSFLLYNDICKVTFRLKPKVYIPFILFIIFATILNFIFIGVDSDKIFERLVHYAEATIMVFPSKNPCLVCEQQSFIALLHRGFGRLFNDPSSLLDNNLFGFALSSEFYGGETMTGPNARIGAYSICAFPGIKIIILYSIFIIFGAINYVLIKITERKKSFIFISSLLVVIDTLQHFVLDYNVAMSNFTLIIFIYIFLTLSFILRFDLKQEKFSI
jgi:hypothetical protein